jgi:hypothetical protein
VARDAEIDVALPDEGGYVGGGKEDTRGMFGFLSVRILILLAMRFLGNTTHSAMWWFCTRQTSSRFGRLNWMSAPDCGDACVECVER